MSTGDPKIFEIVFEMQELVTWLVSLIKMNPAVLDGKKLSAKTLELFLILFVIKSQTHLIGGLTTCLVR